MSNYQCKNIDDLPGVAQMLIPEILDHKIVYFNAPMGAGKTTLIKNICILLGVDPAAVQSPTFGLVNEYKGADHRIFHFDFFRLKTMEEALDIGIEEYFTHSAIFLMEWPEMIKQLIPLPCLEISIEIQDEVRSISTRIINFFETKKIV